MFLKEPKRKFLKKIWENWTLYCSFIIWQGKRKREFILKNIGFQLSPRKNYRGILLKLREETLLTVNLLLSEKNFLKDPKLSFIKVKNLPPLISKFIKFYFWGYFFNWRISGSRQQRFDQKRWFCFDIQQKSMFWRCFKSSPKLISFLIKKD